MFHGCTLFGGELGLTNPHFPRPFPAMAASMLSSPLLPSPLPRYYLTSRPRIPASSPVKLAARGHGGWGPVCVKSRFDELPLGLRSSDSGFGLSDWWGRRKSETLRGGGCRLVCGYQLKEENQPQNNGPDWPVLKRWEVPWEWPTVSLTMLACGLSFILTGLLETTVAPFVSLQMADLSVDDKAGILFVDQLIVTGVVLGVIFGISNRFKPLPDDIFRFKISDPFSLEDGWLLWAVVGLVVAIIAIALLGAGLALFSGESPQRETDALVRLSPLIGSSTVSTAFLVGITGVLAPILEETVFRGYLMVSLTKWVPTPISVLMTAAIFAVAHLTPGEIPQLFVLGTVLGFSYAQTRNLVTPITIHAFWNSGVILLLTFLQLQGYDIKELLQGP